MRNMTNNRRKSITRGYSLMVNQIDEHFSMTSDPLTELQFREIELMAYENVECMKDYCEMLRKETIPLLEE
jgi:hypothetical protein